MTKKKCPLGEACDLTTAWMLGASKAKDQIEALTGQLAAARRDAEEAEAYADELEKVANDYLIAAMELITSTQAIKAKLTKVTAAYRLEAMRRDDYSHAAFEQHLAELTGAQKDGH